MEISKSVVLLANATRTNVTNYFRINFRFVIVLAKTTLLVKYQKM